MECGLLTTLLNKTDYPSPASFNTTLARNEILHLPPLLKLEFGVAWVSIGFAYAATITVISCGTWHISREHYYLLAIYPLCLLQSFHSLFALILSLERNL